MMCTIGIELLHQYEIAEHEKEVIAAQRPPATSKSSAANRELQAAKQRYLESFANWLGHKAFCLHCKPGATMRMEPTFTQPGR
ncbi:hypothetical protein [Granulicella arctica]|uniref:Uncharacterized protein n=1 Tax=Granulicella arctica TaxID=940613 RepID=A0A7Y9TRT2_9BACT|nr:hypothetical protein [Granulicella arctica]NYF78508.1 hypothetical protein [Granulicella arctica]